ncbi:Acyl-CoA N-acyltransferase [Metarhizium album ARSEF 1941]|uniref:Acyl-CoA N-acyltransferase n=1 Tax=Metarhizium album (strain ARSEF 1941) TaxID=1081103 RepID=A0A0B2WTV1_METAS|nr:Acyl-CoA N-acyltransferase [Metarhizium album ARSEF 1941]KHN96892.1 Acyl-CoA N-acyltransferase [Metarhizium album ARSEF 1941]
MFSGASNIFVIYARKADFSSTVPRRMGRPSHSYLMSQLSRSKGEAWGEAEQVDMVNPSPLEWVMTRTTLPASPLPPLNTRPEIRTERLVLRPTLESDLEEWHALRLQPEVMKWTGQGKPDPDINWSKETLTWRLSPEGDAKYEYVVCLADTRQMIGTAGSHMLVGELGWPVIGYLLRKEFWGKGYATELVHAFLKAWWALPRDEVDVKVEKSTAVEEDDGKVRECIVAVTADSNKPSQRVLAKANMRFVKAWDVVGEDDESVSKTLYGYVAQRPVR